MTKTAKLLVTEDGRAVLLPAEFQFEGKTIHIRRSDHTGDVILSSRPRLRWQEFMALRDQFGLLTNDFLADRQQPTQRRDPTDGRQE